jgi:hypothetical protein
LVNSNAFSATSSDTLQILSFQSILRVSLKQQGQGASLLAANGAISEEQRIMSAAAPTDAERFQAPVSLISMGGTHTEMGGSNPVGQKVSEASYVHSGECARRKKQYYFSVLTNTLVETEFFNLWAFMLMQRKREALQIDAKTATAAAMDEKEVLWRVNYEEFVRRLRHQACVALVRSRIDAMAGTVLEGMLDATCRHETSVKQHSSGAWVMWVFLN